MFREEKQCHYTFKLLLLCCYPKWVRRKASGPICWLEGPRPVFALVCYWSAGSYFHFLWSLPVKHNSMERRSMWLSGAIQELGKSRLIHVPFREEASWEQPQHKSPTWRCIPQTCNTDPSLQHFQETGNHRSYSPKLVIRKSFSCFQRDQHCLTLPACSCFPPHQRQGSAVFPGLPQLPPLPLFHPSSKSERRMQWNRSNRRRKAFQSWANNQALYIQLTKLLKIGKQTNKQNWSNKWKIMHGGGKCVQNSVALNYF